MILSSESISSTLICSHSFLRLFIQEGIQCCSVEVTSQERQSTCPSEVYLRPLKCPIRFSGDSVSSQRTITDVSGQDNDALDWNCALWCAGLAEMAIHGVGVRECLHWPCVPIRDKCEQHLQCVPRVCAPPIPASQGFPRSRHCSRGLVPCHAGIHTLHWDCGPSLHPAHVFSHEKAHCRVAVSVSQLSGYWSTPCTGALGITVLPCAHCVRCCSAGCVRGMLAQPTSQGLWQATAAVMCLLVSPVLLRSP